MNHVVPRAELPQACGEWKPPKVRFTIKCPSSLSPAVPSSVSSQVSSILSPVMPWSMSSLFGVPRVLVASESALPRRRLVHKTTPPLTAPASSSKQAKRRCDDASVVPVSKVQQELHEDENQFNVNPSAVRLQMLQFEVMSTQAALSVSIGTDGDGPRWRCALCPWRALSTVPRLVAYVKTKHTMVAKFVWRGTKKLKVVLSMFTLDSLTARLPGNYLRRSASLLRDTVSPGAHSTYNSVDRHVQMHSQARVW